MASYDYISGKKRIEEILDNTLEVVKQDKIPKDENFTFSNAYYGWVSGLFIDIRNSSELFSKEDKEIVSKIIRSFTSEIIEILRKNENLREIGIRGDCVYAIYTTPHKSDEFEVAQIAFYVNTYMKMLQELLLERKFPTISVGIGISTSKELVIKAGRKGVEINNSVWIGDAVTKASNLSSLGNKSGHRSMIFSSLAYNNIIDKLVERNGDKAKTWFKSYTSEEFGTYYDASIIKKGFDDWINDGMLE
jgi:class 3 adenylate cyclase